ncbi:CMP-N-acetylneuraminate-beta-galactosamide-alpha-2,3-sialyltransferase 2-like [Syngnathus acus]|uniref:CMP-N-acetylneuraminate-beta-galactosamide- alpha-2,3-sialyltransferase 2-like n=1 Tax=Syngnathus acus TaxID=161584 RepID=UPI001886096F|nr:CMP-N-acetylneuraminate-beta-galactosamide-alpha-2,3-sialyltransferase 2-like [Syngnathus acus]XP_037120317.1 CMP-N-acetylneuraminate-beta-galactosamide-alpha-2,3-sialyltransferase 2-like [Syngnathus acus]XP_037120318.1 CMP-N-acetylneuraminate-beta-galactosamide-alpha-2,3-sialyltransferase 2-like [Syngnathus acus]
MISCPVIITKTRLKVVLAVLLTGAITLLFLSYSSSEYFLYQSLQGEDDAEFMRRFDESVEPFQNGTNNLSLEVFDWWKTLQPIEEQTLDSYQTVVESLVKTFPAISKRPERWRKCAVVGNSPNLKGSHYGRLIDSHDMVMRMNRGQIKSYEEDVGTKTTHRLMYPESAQNLDNITHLVLTPYKIMDLVWLQKAFTTGYVKTIRNIGPYKIQANKNLVMVVNPGFIAYVYHKWMGKRDDNYPSTGFLAVILALHMCEEVSVFGFGADSDGNWSHYWEKYKRKNLGTGLHYGKREYFMIEQLAARKKINFFKKSSPITKDLPM